MRRFIALATLALLGLSLWMRISSLDSLPSTDGDEAWHAIQLVHMMRGEAFSIRTEHGLPLSPFHAMLELPLLIIAKPSFFLLRIPPLITSILAIWGCYLVASRVFSKEVGIIASVLLAVLPVSVIASRTGYESSHAPLYGLILIHCAFQQRVALLCALLLCCYFVHPTNIFLLPTLLAFLAFPIIRSGGPTSRREWTSFAWKALISTLIVGGIGIFTMLRPITNHLSSTYQVGLRGNHDPVRFAALFGRLFLGTGRTPRPLGDICFWTVFGSVLLSGTFLATRQRRWDLLSLLVGVFLSASGFYIVGGSDILQPGMTRYGLFLVVPTVLVVAAFLSLIRSELANRSLVSLVNVFDVTTLTAGFLLVLSCDLGRLKNQVFDGEPSRTETIWTLRADGKESRRLVLDRILGEIDRDRIHSQKPHVIVTPDFMTRRSFQYLALSRPDVKVVEFHALAPEPKIADVLSRQIRAGAFVVLPPGHPIEATIEWLFAAVPHKTTTIGEGLDSTYKLYRMIKRDEQKTASR